MTFVPEIHQEEWPEIVKALDVPLEFLCTVTGVEPYVMKDYLALKRTPREYWHRQIEEVMKKFKSGKGKRLPYHPSYGYATPEQIKSLETLGLGPDRDAVMAKIREQNENKGWSV